MISNFRDVGGAPTSDGGRVRSGVLYRSATLSGLTAPGIAHLAGLGIRTVIDLRRPIEVETYGRVPDEVGCRWINLPPMHGLWDGPVYDEAAGPARYLADRYGELARDGIAEYGQMLRLIADADNSPTLVHCFAGKDRTGVLVALALALVGVLDAEVAADYAISDEWSTTTGATAGIPHHWLVAPPEAMMTFLTELRTEFGSMRGYAERAGLTAEELAALRHTLVVEV